MAFQGTITGNIGREPEIKYFESGKCKVELTVAIRQRDKDAPAFWVQVDMWNKQAEYAQNYLHKGDTIFAKVLSQKKPLHAEMAKLVTKSF